eukprot:Pgem_evm1s12638
MSNVIRQHNYNIYPVESCIAISPDGKTAVGLYVDEIYKCGPDTTLIYAINKQYPLKHLGEAQVIIGMEIKQSETRMKIHQQQYIQNHTNGNHICKPQQTISAQQPPRIQTITQTISNVHRNHTIPSG